MLLNTEELLALANGDVEPERLASLLDRLEECPDSAAALQVLVSLKANRDEALEALRLAAESDAAVPVPFPQPTAQPTPSTGWATSGLRLAASIAIVGLLGIWAASTFVLEATPPVRDLKITEFVSLFERPEAEMTSSGSLTRRANIALHDGEYEEARDLLVDVPFDEEGAVALYLGMAYYWLEEYEAAVFTLQKIHGLPPHTLESGVRLQGLWYEANALLALDRPLAALPLIEQITTDRYRVERFTDDADRVYDILSGIVGVNRAESDR